MEATAGGSTPRVQEEAAARTWGAEERKTEPKRNWEGKETERGDEEEAEEATEGTDRDMSDVVDRRSMTETGPHQHRETNSHQMRTTTRGKRVDTEAEAADVALEEVSEEGEALGEDLEEEEASEEGSGEAEAVSAGVPVGVATEVASAEEEADSRAVERAAPRLFSITPGAEFRPFSLAGTVEVIGTLCITILVC